MGVPECGYWIDPPPKFGIRFSCFNFVIYAFVITHRHNHYLQECTGIFDPSYHMLAHDIRLLLLRFAYEKSFSAESGGGGPQSNMYLIPYFMHVAIYVMKT